ncbi:MAG: AMP-binding protein, partial [Acidimicrobiales bacterium]
MTRLLQHYLADAAAADAGAIALTFGDDQMTYSEVATLSDRLAARMVDAGVEPGDRVALLLPKSPLAIVAIHAVLKA